MPLPPPVRVGPDFPFVLGSAFGVEDHLEDFLVQGLEQLLVQPGPGTADGGRRHRSRLWQPDPHRPALPPQFGQRGRLSWLIGLLLMNFDSLLVLGSLECILG